MAAFLKAGYLAGCLAMCLAVCPAMCQAVERPTTDKTGGLRYPSELLGAHWHTLSVFPILNVRLQVNPHERAC